MKIRQQLVSYFSVTAIVLVGLTLFFIYQLFADYRKEEYQDRLRDKIVITLKFLAEVEQLDHDMLQQIDKFSINNLYTENLLLFDGNKHLIYSGIDDTRILFDDEVLHQLSPKRKLIETGEKGYDVVGAYVEYNGKPFYGITKAYDTFGFAKLEYLKLVLLIAFAIISVAILFVSNLLAGRISGPLNKMTSEIGTIDFALDNAHINVPDRRDEIHYLATRFNELMTSLHNAFSFQKHAIHHISHELKTPIAILVSNFDRIEKEKDPAQLQTLISNQKEDTKNLGDIINALLEISKIEAGSTKFVDKVRVDELIFDIIEELRTIHEEFNFSVEINGDIESEESLTITGNKRLLKSAFTNLAVNSMNYGTDHQARIVISPQQNSIQISFENKGQIISDVEVPFLFKHFFRGNNSKGKRGFGLGLVFVQRIIEMHKGTVEYTSKDGEVNVFTVRL